MIFVFQILNFALLCGEIYSSRSFKLLKSEYPNSTEKDSLIFDKATKDGDKSSRNGRFSDDDSVFAKLEPMKGFLAKTSNGRESVLNSLYELNAEYRLEEEEKEQRETKNNSLVNKEENISTLLKNIQSLPLIKNKHLIENLTRDDAGSLSKYIDSLRDKAWFHFKSIIQQYVNTFVSEDLNIRDSFLTKLLLKYLDLGDHINIIQLLGRKVDPEVIEFVMQKLQPVTDMLQKSSGNSSFLGIRSAIFPPINNLVNDVAWMAMQQIVQKLMLKIDSKEDLMNYATELSKTNPFAAKGLVFVLNLPSHRPDHSGDGDARSLRYTDHYRNGGNSGLYRDSNYRPRNDRYRDLIDTDKDGYGYHDDGYEEHDGYGYVEQGYGYEMSKGLYLDPYLILAGIGAAALLAYLAYRILTTTAAVTGGMKKRDLDDIDITLSIYNHIEKGEVSFEKEFAEESADLVTGINELWIQRSSETCLKCWLGSNLNIQNLSSFKMLFLSVMSHFFGADQVGPYMDEASLEILAGKKTTCKKRIKECQLKT